MNMLINHCWCSKSIWGGEWNGRVIVSIDRIGAGKTYYDPPTEDWTNLIDKHTFPKPKKFTLSDGTSTVRLKPEVLEWLKENIKDRPRGEHKQGWAIGNDDYNSTNTLSFALFFERTKDAMAFIKRWSVHKKPVDYLNYFRDVRKKLNLKTNRLQRVPR